MRNHLTLTTCMLLWATLALAQLNIQSGNNTILDFDQTVNNVNQGTFTGAGFTSLPSNGQLDADAWALTGMSDGTHNFGDTHTSGDFARGSSSVGVSTGGIYGFTINGSKALGFQPTGSDFTPGSITLKITNNGSATIDNIVLSYDLFVKNDQGRSSSFNFSYSLNNTVYSSVGALNHTTPSAADSSPTWIANNKSTTLTNLSLSSSASIYLRWTSADVSGSGSRDELALDNISISAGGGSTNTCTEPGSPATSLNFGSISSSSIQGNFSTTGADKYLVLRSTSSNLSSLPQDGLIYNTGNALGNATVVQYSTVATFNDNGLSNSTTYYYYVFAGNDNCNGGPDYLSSSFLSGNATTINGGNTGYYASVGNETCADLKTLLHHLIDNHTVVSYSSLWTHYQTTDDHLNDNGNEVIVWDVYSDNPTGAENEFTFVAEQCGNYGQEGDCYNREHSFPKSWWGGSTSVPAYTDIFQVIPADGWINGIRSNNPYGIVQAGTESHITNNGSKLGLSSVSIPGYTGSVFEPIDAYKGDLARGYFYMVTRYENEMASWENSTSEADAVLDGTSFPSLEQWCIDMLVNWHNADPVSQKELDRNESIFAIQGNRNPFIDHPEYVARIWGNCGSTADNQPPTAPSNLTASNITETSAYLSWAAATDNVAVTAYKIYQDDLFIGSTSNRNITINNLSSSTSYDYFVTAIDAAGNESSNSNVVTITTLTPSDTTPPSNPSNLTASNIGETSVDLSWSISSDNVGVTGYHIYQDGALALSSSNNSATIPGLANSTLYNFYITAFDAAGNESAASNTVNVTTLSPNAGPVTIHEGYFESGWDGWADGGSDCARYSGSYASEGNYAIRIRDNSGTASSMTSPVFDLSTFSSVNIEFSFYVRSMESGENFWLRYFDGNSWITVANYIRGTNMNNNSFYTQNVTLPATNFNFPSNAQFRFQCDASGNNDQIFIDEVIIVAEGNNLLRTSPNVDLESEVAENRTALDKEEMDVLGESILLYPNPVSDVLNVVFNSEEDIPNEFFMINSTGQVVKRLNPNSIQSNLQINISKLKPGIYFVCFTQRNAPSIYRKIIVE